MDPEPRRSAAREFAAGIADLGRGFRLWGGSPRLMLLGALPALIVGAVWTGLVLAVIVGIDPLAAFLSPFADDWAQPWRSGVRLIVGVAVLLLTLVLAALTFTAVTLAVGAPFYERISAEVERRMGEPPRQRDEPLLRAALRAAHDGLVLLGASVVVGLLALLAGLIPVVGAPLGVVVGATLGGWFLVVELTGTPFDVRGFTLRERRRALRGTRARTLGLGVVTSLLFLVPLGAVAVMPAAVGGATVLARSAIARARPEEVADPVRPVAE